MSFLEWLLLLMNAAAAGLTTEVTNSCKTGMYGEHMPRPETPSIQHALKPHDIRRRRRARLVIKRNIAVGGSNASHGEAGKVE